MAKKKSEKERPRIEAPASEVKNAWHEYVDRLARLRETIVVTRYGKPIMQLTPVEERESGGVVGFLAGTVNVHGDIVAPLGDEWEASA